MSGAAPALPSNPNEDAGPKILGVTIAVTAAALITVLVRLYVRFFMVRAPGWDDWLMTFAITLSVTGQAIIIPQVQYGAGRHIGDIDPGDAMLGIKLNFVSQPIYLWCILFVKLAVGSSLLRIASTKPWRIAILSVMGFMAFYTLGCFFTIVLQCNNLAFIWDPTVSAKCWTIPTLQGLSYTNVGLNILTDLIFALIIPIPMLWNLRMNSRTKLSLMAILGLGIFACVAAIVKIPQLVDYGKEGDRLWDTRNITIWTVVEANTGIIAGSLPCLKPLFIRILGSTYGTGSGPQNLYSHSKSARPTSRIFRTLGSKSVPEDSESQSRFGIGDEAHMMAEMDKNKVATNTVERSGSEDSLERLAQGRVGGQDIIKTTTTTVDTYWRDSQDQPSLRGPRAAVPGLGRAI